jgi:uncharacterized protein (UPF0261 family)
MAGIIYAIATRDMKGEEIAFVAQQARLAGAQVVTVDVGTSQPPSVTPDIPRERVAACHPAGAFSPLGQTDRGEAVIARSAALVAFLKAEYAEGKIGGVIGLGGSGGTALIAPALREALEARGFDCLVFHPTGTAGQAIEKLVASGLMDGVLDITTTEVADEVVSGVFPAGPARFGAIIERRIPCVMSLGALDMVNFGARDTVPAAFRGRKLHGHNSQVTLMRTTPEENRQFARWIAGKINRSQTPLIILIPERGVSALDAPGQPFPDLEADAALFDELERAVQPTPTRQIRRLPYHINDPAFARALVEAFFEAA